MLVLTKDCIFGSRYTLQKECLQLLHYTVLFLVRIIYFLPKFHAYFQLLPNLNMWLRTMEKYIFGLKFTRCKGFDSYGHINEVIPKFAKAAICLIHYTDRHIAVWCSIQISFNRNSTCLELLTMRICSF